MNNTFFKNKKTVLMNVALCMCIVLIMGLFLSLATSSRSKNNASVAHTHIYVDGSCIYCDVKKVSKGFVFELNESGDSYSIVSYGTCFDTELYIPSSYKGLPVTSVSEGAFEKCMWISNVVFPDTVTYIGKNAFNQCKSLKTISFPNSELTIANGAFTRCDSLILVTLPEKIKSIYYSFNLCYSLKYIHFTNISSLIYCYSTLGSASSNEPGKFIENGCGYYSTNENRYAIFASKEGSSYCLVRKEVEFVAHGACSGSKDIYYEGSENEWNSLRFSSPGDKSCEFLYFYSETEPVDGGKYWHYVDNAPTIW